MRAATTAACAAGFDISPPSPFLCLKSKRIARNVLNRHFPRPNLASLVSPMLHMSTGEDGQVPRLRDISLATHDVEEAAVKRLCRRL
jgi:hypothetical protein